MPRRKRLRWRMRSGTTVCTSGQQGDYSIWSSAVIEQEAEIFAAALMHLLDQRGAQRAAHAA